MMVHFNTQCIKLQVLFEKNILARAKNSLRKKQNILFFKNILAIFTVHWYNVSKQFVLVDVRKVTICDR